MKRTTTTSSCHCNPSCQPEQVYPSGSITRKTAKAVPALLLSILVAFFPKCPFCWAAYMSMFGGIGLAKLPYTYMSWLVPVLLLTLCIHLVILYRRSSRQGYLPLLLSLTGTLILLSGRNFFPLEKWLLVVGMVLITTGSLINSFLSSDSPALSHLKKNLKLVKYDTL